MNAKTHKAMGLFGGLLLADTPYINNLIALGTNTTNEAISAGLLFLGSSVLGSLLTDGDSEDSSAGWWLYPIFRRFFAERKRKIRNGEAYPEMYLHRHIVHSIWVPLALATLGAMLAKTQTALVSLIFFGLSVGYVTHLIGDWIMSKVYLLSPFSEKGFSLLHLEGKPKAQKVCDAVFYVLSIIGNLFLIAKEVFV